jgi:hypothetical protein
MGQNVTESFVNRAAHKNVTWNSGRILIGMFSAAHK